MRLGWYISGGVHAGLLVLAIWGGIFARDRIPDVKVSDVSVISEEEFAALTAPQAAPDFVQETPEVTAPALDETAPDAPAPDDDAPEIAEPDAVETPEAPENVPEELPDPLPPEAVVEDNAPVIDTPETLIDGTTPVPDAVAQPAPRVAPLPQVAPPPLADVAPEVVEDTAPDPEAPPEEVVEDETPAAPEEASDRIVTEAEEQDLAPATSMRPRTRPSRPVRVAEDPTPEAEPEPQPQPAEDDTAERIAAAVSEANQAAPTTDAPVGPPLTGGEKDALRVAVQQCWNVGSLSTEALGTTVVLEVAMGRDGKPQNGSIRMLTHSGGSAAAATQAFEAARRAIIRCGSRGFPLPEEKYAQWRDIEMTFNPEGMQFR